jgi:hypothetical protein
LRFRQANLPGVTGILDAGERRCTRASRVAGDDNVVGIGFRYAGRHRANSTFGYQLNADGGTRVYPLEVENELSKILNGVNVVVGRRADERNARLSMAQTGD